MRDVAVISFSQAKSVRREADRNEVEILMPVVHEARDRAGLDKRVDFICSGSSDYLAGQSFAFVSGLDSVGAWPPISESHVEADGAETHAKVAHLAPGRRLACRWGEPRLNLLEEAVEFVAGQRPFELEPSDADLRQPGRPFPTAHVAQPLVPQDHLVFEEREAGQRAARAKRVELLESHVDDPLA